MKDIFGKRLNSVCLLLSGVALLQWITQDEYRKINMLVIISITLPIFQRHKRKNLELYFLNVNNSIRSKSQ